MAIMFSYISSEASYFYLDRGKSSSTAYNRLCVNPKS